MCLSITVYVFQSVLVIFHMCSYQQRMTTSVFLSPFVHFFMRCLCVHIFAKCVFYMKNSASVSCFKHNCLFYDFSKECFPKCPISLPPPAPPPPPPPPPPMYVRYVSNMLECYCQLLRLNHCNQDKTYSTAEDSGPQKGFFFFFNSLSLSKYS